MEQPEQAGGTWPSSGSEASSSRSDDGSSEGGASPLLPNSRTSMSLAQAMLEVEIRFLMNIPEEELNSVDRLFFQVEQAHWHYEDFLADQYEGLPHFSLEGFAEALFSHSTLLQPLRAKVTDLLKDFNSYKYSVPVYGTALLNPNMDRILLVCNWQGTSWGLPRGKVNQGEQPIECAARETFEETGFDPVGRINEDASFFVVQNSKRMKVYVIRDVPEDFVFQPQVRKEVKEARFWPLDALPKNSWNVQPCIAHVKRWVGQYRSGGADGSDSSRKERKPQMTRKGSQKDMATANSRRGGRQAQKGEVQRLVTSSQSRRSRSAPTYRDAYDSNNVATFGAQDSSWDANAMFLANEKLTGKKFTYDGNPHAFGDYTAKPTSTSEREVSQPPPKPVPSSTTVKGKNHKHVYGRRDSCPVPGNQMTTVAMAEKVIPAVAALVGLAPVLKEATQKGEGGGAEGEGEGRVIAGVVKKPFVHSCASIESGQAVVGCGPVEPGGMDLLGGFQFDTSDILSALQF